MNPVELPTASARPAASIIVPLGVGGQSREAFQSVLSFSASFRFVFSQSSQFGHGLSTYEPNPLTRLW